MLGETISHYRILQKIGAGGMGIVYRAHDDQLDRDVALKVLPASTLAGESARKQFRKEALALARLNHPNIETVFEFNSENGVDFLALELIPGHPLSEKLKDGPLAEKEILRLGMQLAEGLAAAHSQGVIHRDLKPANLFITPDGRLKILDFGLARLRHPELDATATRSLTESVGGISGTVPYMSPEQLRGQPADARSDIYSAGAVLYEMSTGRRPFPQTQTAELMGAILHESPATPSALNPRLSPALENAVLKSLEKEPSRRYQSARELHAVLESLTSRTTSASAALAPQTESSRRADRLRVSRKAKALERRNAKLFARQALRESRLRRAVSPSSARWGYATAIFVIVGFLAAFGFNLGGVRSDLFPSARALNDKDTIVLADFDNRTDDPVFDGTLRQGLSVQLEQSPFLSMISDDSIQQTLQLMKQPPDARLTPEVARGICERTASAAVLDGSIAQIGAQYLLTLKAVNCSSGDTFASTEAQASDKNHVLDALGKIASDMRNKLGESLSTVQKFNTPLEQATTTSIDALKVFSSAVKIHATAGDTAAIPVYLRAAELDHNFALVYAWLSIAYNDIGEPSVAADYTRKAYQLRDRVSEPERYFIMARYEKEVTGNMPKAIQACQLWIQAYPRAAMPHDLLSGAIYPVTGQYAEALETGKEAIRLEPHFPASYYLPMSNAISLNRPDEAESIYRQALGLGDLAPFFHSNLYELAFLQRDSAGMAEQLAWAKGKPGIEDESLNYKAETAGFFGRLKSARDDSRQATDSAQSAGKKEAAALYLAQAALREALFGNADEARRRAALALKSSTGRDVEYAAALAFAFAEDSGRAEPLADALARNYPEDTIVRSNFLPALHGKLALNRGNAGEAIESLQAATQDELGQTTHSPYGWTAMYPAYVRGEAYLAQQKGTEAAAEFQKILDHPGVLLFEPIGALAHLQIARAYALQAQSAQGPAADAVRAKSRAAYQDFLTLWKDADPDIPILKQAKSESVKLQ